MFSLIVVVLGLISRCKESSQSLLGLPRLWGPSEVLVKRIVEFNCELLAYPQNETILFQLYREDNRGKVLAEYSSLDGQMASFPLIAKLHQEGNMVCVAKAQNNSNIEPTVSSPHYLKVIEKVQGAAIVVLSGSVDMFEGETLELNCTLTAGNHVSYKWQRNNKNVSQSHLHDGRLLISRTTSADSGSYICVATNNFNRTEIFTSTSPAVNVTVKVPSLPPSPPSPPSSPSLPSPSSPSSPTPLPPPSPSSPSSPTPLPPPSPSSPSSPSPPLPPSPSPPSSPPPSPLSPSSPSPSSPSSEVVSEPNISFKVLKEDSHSFSATITCETMRGTPPVTFSLYNNTELIERNTVDERKATFKVPLILDQHMGRFQCRANNGNGTTVSRWIPLEVVPVGGPVTIQYDYDLGENYAVIGLRFYCKAAKGSFPRYRWFLNNTLLSEEHDRGSFYYVFNQPPEQSILLLSVGWNCAGTYHCEVSDSFDNSTAISSKKRYLDQDVVNRLPLLVKVVVFGSFTFLILLVSFCCCIGVFIRRRLPPQKPLPSWEMNRMVMEVDSNLDLPEYNEDPDVVAAAREDILFDLESLVSVDEWPQIVKQKKTLEDEPDEEA